MELDLYTLQITASLIVFASVVSFLALWRSEQKPSGSGYWLAGSALTAPGLVMMGFRGVIPEFFSQVVGLSFLVGGILLMNRGFLCFTGRRINSKLDAAILTCQIVPFLIFTYVYPHHSARVALTAIILLCVIMNICYILMSDKKAPWRPAGLAVGSVFGLMALALVGRLTSVFMNWGAPITQGGDAAMFFLSVIFILGAITMTITFLSYAALSSEYRLFASAVYQSSSSIVITDSVGKMTYANPGFRRKSGRDIAELLASDRPYDFGEMNDDQQQELWDAIEAGDTWRGELKTVDSEGNDRWELTTISPIRQKGGRISHLVAVQEDISALKEAEAKIRYLAYHDALTGLPSLRLAQDRLEDACRLARRNKCQVGVMFVDLDGFKQVNDTHGHDGGDRLLIDVADRMQECVRDSDTVARIGGDEFLIVLRQVQDADCTDRIAEDLIDKITKPIILDSGASVVVGASVGIAFYPQHGETAQEVLKTADDAMYQVKRAGKNDYKIAA